MDRTCSEPGLEAGTVPHGAGKDGKDGSVRIASCDGSPAQKWDIGADGTIRSQRYAGHCLTRTTDSAGLARCETTDKGQRWSSRPWPDRTWKRKAWMIAGEGDTCLLQDDRPLPSRWDAQDNQHPRLGLLGCSAQIRPGLYWSRRG
ncbi:RICIN domain-containing protein [Streptomyces sp. NPDC050423]|uniref:RICIN domain-containing protein n=1 Tax=Streptomyces sp. NPDC050423 TaxID=3155402 RepID=UPI003420ABA1